MKKVEISELRKKIESVDLEILNSLSVRRKLSREIINCKNEMSSPIRNLEREESLLNTLLEHAKVLDIEPYFVKKIFQEIIEDSIKYQQKIAQKFFDDFAKSEKIGVAIQGIVGSYSSMAAMKYFGLDENKINFLGKNTFTEVLELVENGEVEYAMLPIENTTSGGINEAYDALIQSNLNIVGEEIYPVNHCLVSKENMDLSEIKIIYAHPQAAVQCNKFLATLTNCKIEYFPDTAMSAQKIFEETTKTNAAIASREAAEIFKLKILNDKIANQEGNYTRFLVIAKKMKKVDKRIPCKTSLVMAISQKSGSLVDALTIFKEFSVNMTKLESRPIIGNPWEEMFYLDFEGNLEDENIIKVIEKLGASTKYLKVLGCYPSYYVDFKETPVPSVIEKVKQKEEVKISSSKKGSFKLASRHYRAEDTVIDVKGLKIGGGNFVVIAGPCSVESEKQIIETARVVKDNGAQILRGGCFKPRTSPYAFQGMGLEGLDLLYKAGNLYNLPIITEILSEEYLHEVVEKSDIIQIGARNMQNFALLKEVGKIHKPVLLKRGMMSSIDELLNATEYILSGGNRQVILCERGIRTFETATRNTLDLSAIPVIKELSHLPVFVDPSHAVGERNKVIPMALAAKAVGADGIMIEIHPEPENALSDGPQSLYFDQFNSMMSQLK